MKYLFLGVLITLNSNLIAQPNQVENEKIDNFHILLSIGYRKNYWANGSSNYKQLENRPVYRVGVAHKFERINKPTWMSCLAFQSQHLTRPNGEGSITIRNAVLGNYLLFGNKRLYFSFGVDVLVDTKSILEGNTPGHNSTNIDFTDWNISPSIGLQFSIKQVNIGLVLQKPIKKIFTVNIPSNVIPPGPDKALPPSNIWKATEGSFYIILPINHNL